jgi:ATP-dependent Clp protease ATP-binding subunit ClpB
MVGKENYAEMKAAVMEDVTDHFRPEFINRIDDVVVFHPLDREQIRQIVDIQLASLRKRLLDRDLLFDVSAEAMDLLADAGFDPVYGARPLKRAIQQRLENPLAEAILRGDFAPGDQIEVTAVNDELEFNKASPAAA